MVRVGILGCGFIGTTIAGSLQDMDEVELIPLYDRDYDMTFSLAGKINKASVFTPENINGFIESSDLVVESASQEAGVEIRGCSRTQALVSGVPPATEEDWLAEYLDLILALRVVDDLNQAIDHISRYGSMHSEAIVTTNYSRARKFLYEVDAAAVYVNASTRFTDGGAFGLGAEIGISTQKLHARGPMGVRDLTTTKYIIFGDGQIRE